MSEATVPAKKNTLFDFLFLFFSVGVYSFVSVFLKLAAKEEALLSFWTLFYLACAVGVLGVYAILWQMILRRFELSVAYSAKPFSTILTIVWGIVFFGEIDFSAGLLAVLSQHWNKLVGAVILAFGMRMVMKDHE